MVIALPPYGPNSWYVQLALSQMYQLPSVRERSAHGGQRFFGTGFVSSFVSVTLSGAIIATISAALGAVR